MLNNTQLLHVIRLIRGSKRPAACMAVFMASMAFIREGTCIIAADTREISEETGVSIPEVRAAFRILTELEVFHQIGPRRYAVNPDIGWKGPLVAWEEAKAAWRAKGWSRLPEIPKAKLAAVG